MSETTVVFDQIEIDWMLSHADKAETDEEIALVNKLAPGFYEQVEEARNSGGCQRVMAFGTVADRRVMYDIISKGEGKRVIFSKYDYN